MHTREFLGYLVGAAFASVAMLMMGLAWIGLEQVFNWQMALGLLVFSLFIRVNLFLLGGIYLFASQVWGLPMLEALVFTLPSLMYVAPIVTMPLFGAISRPYTA